MHMPVLVPVFHIKDAPALTDAVLVTYFCFALLRMDYAGTTFLWVLDPDSAAHLVGSQEIESVEAGECKLPYNFQCSSDVITSDRPRHRQKFLGQHRSICQYSLTNPEWPQGKTPFDLISFYCL